MWFDIVNVPLPLNEDFKHFLKSISRKSMAHKLRKLMKDSIKEEFRKARLGVRKPEGRVQLRGLLQKEKASQRSLP